MDQLPLFLRLLLLRGRELSEEEELLLLLEGDRLFLDLDLCFLDFLSYPIITSSSSAASTRTSWTMRMNRMSVCVCDFRG